jgi:hypothetical protein
MHGEGERLHLASLQQVVLLAGRERGRDSCEMSHLPEDAPDVRSPTSSEGKSMAESLE